MAGQASRRAEKLLLLHLLWLLLRHTLLAFICLSLPLFQCIRKGVQLCCHHAWALHPGAALCCSAAVGDGRAGRVRRTARCWSVGLSWQASKHVHQQVVRLGVLAAGGQLQDGLAIRCKCKVVAAPCASSFPSCGCCCMSPAGRGDLNLSSIAPSACCSCFCCWSSASRAFSRSAAMAACTARSRRFMAASMPSICCSLLPAPVPCWPPSPALRRCLASVAAVMARWWLPPEAGPADRLGVEEGWASAKRSALTAAIKENVDVLGQ